MSSRYRKTRPYERPLTEFVNTMYGQAKTDTMQWRLSPDLKRHIFERAAASGMSASNFIEACVVKEIGKPRATTVTYMKDEEI